MIAAGSESFPESLISWKPFCEILILIVLYLSSELVAGGSVQSLPHSLISHGLQYEIHVGGAAP